jgi:DNA-binding transcriptional ArsR family regulator
LTRQIQIHTRAGSPPGRSERALTDTSGTKLPLLIANIHEFEYTIVVNDELRRFKSEIFQGLAHPTRIAIVELLRDREMPAGKLIEKLGIEQANASQHLSVLRAKQIVLGRKVGNQVFYSIRDHALIEVLDILRGYFYSQLSTTVSMLKEVARQEPKSRASANR